MKIYFVQTRIAQKVEVKNRDNYFSLFEQIVFYKYRTNESVCDLLPKKKASYQNNSGGRHFLIKIFLFYTTP